MVISLYDYFNYMGRTADFLSKVAGDIGPGKLEEYAK